MNIQDLNNEFDSKIEKIKLELKDNFTDKDREYLCKQKQYFRAEKIDKINLDEIINKFLLIRHVNFDFNKINKTGYNQYFNKIKKINSLIEINDIGLKIASDYQNNNGNIKPHAKINILWFNRNYKDFHITKYNQIIQDYVFNLSKQEKEFLEKILRLKDVKDEKNSLEEILFSKENKEYLEKKLFSKNKNKNKNKNKEKEYHLGRNDETFTLIYKDIKKLNNFNYYNIYANSRNDCFENAIYLYNGQINFFENKNQEINIKNNKIEDKIKNIKNDILKIEKTGKDSISKLEIANEKRFAWFSKSRNEIHNKYIENNNQKIKENLSKIENLNKKINYKLNSKKPQFEIFKENYLNYKPGFNTNFNLNENLIFKAFDKNNKFEEFIFTKFIQENKDFSFAFDKFKDEKGCFIFEDDFIIQQYKLFNNNKPQIRKKLKSICLNEENKISLNKEDNYYYKKARSLLIFVKIKNENFKEDYEVSKYNEFLSEEEKNKYLEEIYNQYDYIVADARGLYDDIQYRIRKNKIVLDKKKEFKIQDLLDIFTTGVQIHFNEDRKTKDGKIKKQKINTKGELISHKAAFSYKENIIPFTCNKGQNKIDNLNSFAKEKLKEKPYLIVVGNDVGRRSDESNRLVSSIYKVFLNKENEIDFEFKKVFSIKPNNPMILGKKINNENTKHILYSDLEKQYNTIYSDLEQKAFNNLSPEDKNILNDFSDKTSIDSFISSYKEKEELKNLDFESLKDKGYEISNLLYKFSFEDNKEKDNKNNIEYLNNKSYFIDFKNSFKTEEVKRVLSILREKKQDLMKASHEFNKNSIQRRDLIRQYQNSLYEEIKNIFGNDVGKIPIYMVYEEIKSSNSKSKKNITKKSNDKDLISIRNWDKYKNHHLSSMNDLKREAKMNCFSKGWFFTEIDPYYTSQVCNTCLNIEILGNREYEQFICKNQNCSDFNKEKNADENAAKNIAYLAFSGKIFRKADKK